MDDYAVNVTPGPGVIARWDAGVVVAGGSADEAPAVIARLQEALGERASSGALIELLRSDPGFSDGVELAALVSTPGGVRAFVRGSMQVRTETNELITGPAPTERDLPPAMALWIGVVDPPGAQGHPVMDLKRGVVPGGGAVVHQPMAAEVAPPAAPQRIEVAMPAPPDISPDPSYDPSLSPVPGPPQPPSQPPAQAAAEPAVSRPFQAIDWAATPAETREPLEVLDPASQAAATKEEPAADQVLGINCSRDHFNNPNAGYCQVCGISMVHLTHRLEPGPRPTLGFVVFADGATYAMDRPYLIGRSPQPTEDSGLTALATQDSTQSVSREHAELRLQDWNVVYTDLGSTNGSFLWDSAARRWNPVQAGVPVVLHAPSTVSVGRMTFVFEGASRAVEAR